MNRPTPRLSACVCAAFAFICLMQVHCVEAAQRSAAAPPAAKPATRSADEIMTDMHDAGSDLSAILGGNTAKLGDPRQRAQIAPQAILLVKRIARDAGDLVASQPESRDRAEELQSEMLSLGIALGDKDSQDRVAAMLASTDSQTRIRGQCAQLQARWYQAIDNAPLQSAIADDLEKIDKANPASGALTSLTYTFSQGAATPALQQRLQKLAGEMANPLATAVAQELQVRQRMPRVGQPLFIEGKTTDGADFSTKQWKGKVVLVDFWATWCPPCREATPALLQLYESDHPKGLEIVGVSSDYHLNELQAYAAENKMPWTQLFDPSAAAAEQWNSVAMAHGVLRLPTMFVIDRKGILRDNDAEQNLDQLIPKLLAE